MSIISISIGNNSFCISISVDIVSISISIDVPTYVRVSFVQIWKLDI